FAVATAGSAGQALAEGCRQFVETLPGGVEFTGLRALFGDAEAVVLEELASHRPYFGWRVLGQHPAAAATALQAVVGDLGGTAGQRLRTRHFELAAGAIVGDVTRDRQQRVKALDVAGVRRQLH